MESLRTKSDPYFRLYTAMAVYADQTILVATYHMHRPNDKISYSFIFIRVSNLSAIASIIISRSRPILFNGI